MNSGVSENGVVGKPMIDPWDLGGTVLERPNRLVMKLA